MMSVPRPAMLVAMVTAPALPAWAIISASRSTFSGLAFSKLWGIPTDAIAYKGKDKLDEDYVVQPSDNLEFHRRAGEKG